MNRLTEIANKYSTDKGTNNVCDNNRKGHGFTEFYFDYFNGLEHPIILELGVWQGNSIRMFNEFYNGDCEIYCIDIDQKRNVSDIGDNIHFYVVDLSDEKQLADFVEKMGDIRFDIILDDASHLIYHQMLTYSYFRKLLKEKGMYVMEDLHCNFGDCWSYNKDEKTTTLDFFVNFIPYHRFSDEKNIELLGEIETVNLFSNNNHSTPPHNLQNLRMNRSMTAIITIKR